MASIADIIAAGKRTHAAVQTRAAQVSSPARQPAKVSTPSTRQPAKVSTPSRSSGSSGGGGGGYSGGSGGYSSGGSSGGGGGGGSYSGGADYSGGGGDYSGGGGDFGSFAAEPVQTEVTIPDPLAQESYKRAKAEMLRARGDFDAQQNLARSQYDASFDDSQRQLGWRNAIPRVGLRRLQEGEGNDGAGFDPNAQGTSYGDAYQANQGDFAGRGLFNSGLYAQAVSNVNNQFTDRRNSALRDQKDWRDTQELNKKNFYGQQDSADLAAQESAIGEIMASLGVSRDQITPGRQNVIMK